VVIEQSEAPLELRGEAETALGVPLRILVVDDNRDAADSLALMLRLVGHELRTAHDGIVAVGAAREFRPDVVLLDIGLPGQNGYEVARQIREQSAGARTVLIAMTGWGQDDDRRRSQEAGFDTHLVKPVDPGVLLRLLQSTQRVKSTS
jgi:DNA-binding response OmpR family regulator